MIIVTKKKDYYDGVQALGQDRDIRYIREEKHIPLKKWPFPRIDFLCYSDWSVDYGCNPYIIGFCGKIYPVIVFFPISERMFTKKRKKVFCFSSESVDNFVNNIFKNTDFYYKKRFAWYSMNGFSRDRIAKFFKDCEDKKESYSNIFIDERSPVFLAKPGGDLFIRKSDYNNPEIVFNVLLKDFNFATIKDPYTAFQDLRMFMSNLAMPDKPMLQLSNDDMIESKGHDLKYSFRKPPSKKRK